EVAWLREGSRAAVDRLPFRELARPCAGTSLCWRSSGSVSPPCMTSLPARYGYKRASKPVCPTRTSSLRRACLKYRDADGGSRSGTSFHRMPPFAVRVREGLSGEGRWKWRLDDSCVVAL